MTARDCGGVGFPANNPVVSVVMPAFNARRFVAQAVESILAQTFDDFEFIIVDDGSTDGTGAILQQFASQDCRIRLIQQANAGVCTASNRAIAVARGEFYARFDHDDIAMPHRLQREVDFLRAHAECVAVGSQVLMIDEDGFPIRIATAPTEHEAIESAFAREPCMFHPTLMVRMTALREIGGYREKFSSIEDLDLFVRLAERGRLANLAEALVQYRQHVGSVCYTRYDAQTLELQALLSDAEIRRGKAIARQAADIRHIQQPARGRRQAMWSFEKMWAWWALAGGYPQTARRHALRALRLGPLRAETWLLLACVLRGR